MGTLYHDLLMVLLGGTYGGAAPVLVIIIPMVIGAGLSYLLFKWYEHSGSFQERVESFRLKYASRIRVDVFQRMLALALFYPLFLVPALIAINGAGQYEQHFRRWAQVETATLANPIYVQYYSRRSAIATPWEEWSAVSVSTTVVPNRPLVTYLP